MQIFIIHCASSFRLFYDPVEMLLVNWLFYLNYSGSLLQMSNLYERRLSDPSAGMLPWLLQPESNSRVCSI